jgi:hypothetical protein
VDFLQQSLECGFDGDLCVVPLVRSLQFSSKNRQKKISTTKECAVM